MPRHSPFQVTLTPQERQTLEGRARQYTSPYRDVLRAKIVLLAAEGLSNDVIAHRLDTPRQIVSKWRKRFCLGASRGSTNSPGAAGHGCSPASGSPSRPWRVSCRDAGASRSRSGRAPSSSGPYSPRASSRRSAAPRFGAGSPPTPSSPGASGVGSSPATPPSPPRPAGSSTCTSGGGTGGPSARPSTCCPPTRRPASRARARCHPTLPPGPGAPMRVEHEYVRGGAWAYHAAWDVHRAKTGLLVTPGNILALRDALLDYCRNPERRAAHGKTGRANMIAWFQRETVWQLLFAEYIRLLREKKGLPAEGSY